jgi:hypothetical protein
MLPYAFLRPFPMGLVPAAVFPRMGGMLDNLRVHELQKERDLSAVHIGSNPSSGPQNVNR